MPDVEHVRHHSRRVPVSAEYQRARLVGTRTVWAKFILLYICLLLQGLNKIRRRQQQQQATRATRSAVSSAQPQGATRNSAQQPCVALYCNIYCNIPVYIAIPMTYQQQVWRSFEFELRTRGCFFCFFCVLRAPASPTIRNVGGRSSRMYVRRCVCNHSRTHPTLSASFRAFPGTSLG